jgi:hypothetical protein
MCTVSVILPGSLLTPLPDSPRCRIVFNRDERRDRPRAEAPTVSRGTRTRSAMPVDLAGPGTWIAVNDAGLVFALLNAEERNGRQAESVKAADLMSRGLIIPQFVDAISMDDVRQRARQLAWRRHRGFRLFVFGATSKFLEVRPLSDGLAILDRTIQTTFMATSSSQEPAEAARLRRNLFQGLVPRPDPELQDIFHAHRWRSCPEYSVLMSRPDACTVSRTVVECFADHASLRYQPVTADGRLPALNDPSARTGLASAVLPLQSDRAGAA